MKLASYRVDGRYSYGVVTEGGLVDAPTALPDGPSTLLEAVRQGSPALDKLRTLGEARPDLSMDDVSLTAPISCPPKLLGIAVNYVEHHREFDRGHDLPDDPSNTTTPRPFLMPPTAVANPGDEIPWPTCSEQIDYEVELAVVIGRPARNLAPDEVDDVIAGFTIANDISARSMTHGAGRSPRPKDDFFDWLHGKWCDGFCPMGPVLVTPDQIGDWQKLAISLDVNGRTRQDACTDQMIFSVRKLVAFCSRLMTLTPGDVIATGTPSGVGMPTGELLQPGDTITCRIEGIGEMTNTMGPRPKRFYTPCLRD
ncbi:MAG: fumarylacetoacetate hydrolase family protein [Phycisphaerae bacterium]